MIPLQSHQILNVEVFFQLNHVDFIAIKKKKFYFLYSHFLNKTMFKDKTYIMSSSTRSLQKPKTIKNGKKNGIGYSFARKKRCSRLSARNTKKNWKRCLASLRYLYKGMTISRHLLCKTIIKVRCTCKLLINANIWKVEYVESNISDHCLFQKMLPFWKGLIKSKPLKKQVW